MSDHSSAMHEPWHEQHPVKAGLLAAVIAFVSVVVILATVLLTTG